MDDRRWSVHGVYGGPLRPNGRPMRLFPLIWSLSLTLVPLTGCHASSCGQTGCLGTVELLLSQAMKQPGDYVFDVQVGAGDTVRCTVSHPAGPTSCDQRWADVLTGSQGTLDGVILYRTDITSVGVSVARDGQVIGGGTYAPQYEKWFPNGPICDDKPCQHALVEVGVVGSPKAATTPQ